MKPLIILTALIDSKLYIALAALVLCLETQVQLGMPMQVHPYLFVVFFATLCVYNFPKASVLFHRSSLRHKRSFGFFALLFSALIGLAISLLMAQQEILAVVIPLGSLTLWYSIPFLKTVKLRNIPYAKIFVIAFIWSAATVLIPFVHPSCTRDFFAVVGVFAERFFFIFAITIPFDMRDIALDQRSGLKTLPMLFDQRGSQKLSIVALMIFFSIATFHYAATHQHWVLLALGLSFALTLSFLCVERLRQWPLYYHALLDGSMLLQGLLVILCQQMV